MRRLIVGFAGRTYNIDGNLMPRLNCYLHAHLMIYFGGGIYLVYIMDLDQTVMSLAI